MDDKKLHSKHTTNTNNFDTKTNSLTTKHCTESSYCMTTNTDNSTTDGNSTDNSTTDGNSTDNSTTDAHNSTLRTKIKLKPILHAGDVDMNSDPEIQEVNVSNATVYGHLKYLFAGGMAGAVSRTITAPLDRLKVLLQTSTQNHRSFSHIVSIKKGIREIYKDGGFLSFFKGNGLNILKIIPESALKFYVFENAKELIVSQELFHTVHSIDDLGLGARLAAGGVAGLVSQFAIYPIETIKTRIMSQISRPSSLAYNNPQSNLSYTNSNNSNNINTNINNINSNINNINSNINNINSNINNNNSNNGKKYSVSQAIKSLYKEGGIRAFYRGCAPALVGIMPYAGVDLAVFETLKNIWIDRERKHRASSSSPLSINDHEKGDDTSSLSLQVPIHIVLTCGMISGTCGAVLMYPLALIRTRLQAQGTPSHPTYYTSSFDVIKKTYIKEGIVGFYRGLAPTLLKVLPAVSISYLVYERSKALLNIT